MEDMNEELDKFLSLIFRPKRFFGMVAEEKHFYPIFVYLFVFFFFVFALWTLFFLGALGVGNSWEPILLLIISLLFGLLRIFCSCFFNVVVLSLVVSGVVNLGVILFRGKSDFFDTFKVSSYGLVLVPIYMIPISFFFLKGYEILIVWFICGILLLHMSMFVTIGLSRFHQFPFWRSFLCSILFDGIVVLWFLSEVIILANFFEHDVDLMLGSFS